MNKILFVNVCVRENSRTYELARVALEQLNGEVSEVRLDNTNIKMLDSEKLELRDSLVANKDFLNEEFSYANQFAQADEIVIAAPYWDLSFPSLLKAYLEAISINGITFQYNEKGVPKGLCRAKRVIYITTAGGFIGDLNLGYDYVKAFFERILGIKEALFFKAEALDVYGTDIEAVLEESKKEIINTLG